MFNKRPTNATLQSGMELFPKFDGILKIMEKECVELMDSF